MRTARNDLTETERSAILGHEWFSSLPDSLQQRILGMATVRRYLHGAPIAVRGGDASHWIGCAHGSVRVCSASVDGKEFTLTYVPGGVWFGDPGLFDGRELTHDAFAHGATTLLLVARKDLEALVDSDAAFSRSLLVSQAKWTRVLYRFVEMANHSSVEARLARQLVALTRLHGEPDVGGEPRIGLSLRQDEIACMIGASRQRVNLHLKRFERAGLIKLCKQQIGVRDMEGLASLATSPAERPLSGSWRKR